VAYSEYGYQTRGFEIQKEGRNISLSLSEVQALDAVVEKRKVKLSELQD